MNNNFLPPKPSSATFPSFQTPQKASKTSPEHSSCSLEIQSLEFSNTPPFEISPARFGLDSPYNSIQSASICAGQLKGGGSLFIPSMPCKTIPLKQALVSVEGGESPPQQRWVASTTINSQIEVFKFPRFLDYIRST